MTSVKTREMRNAVCITIVNDNPSDSASLVIQLDKVLYNCKGKVQKVYSTFDCKAGRYTVYAKKEKDFQVRPMVYRMVKRTINSNEHTVKFSTKYNVNTEYDYFN